VHFKQWCELIENQSIIYQDDSGYISGYLRKDGYWWINELVVYPKQRGKHLARKLADHLPYKSKLLAFPMFGKAGKTLTQDQLIAFYQSLGFVRTTDEFGNVIMERG